MPTVFCFFKKSSSLLFFDLIHAIAAQRKRERGILLIWLPSKENWGLSALWLEYFNLEAYFSFFVCDRSNLGRFNFIPWQRTSSRVTPAPDKVLNVFQRLILLWTTHLLSSLLYRLVHIYIRKIETSGIAEDWTAIWKLVGFLGRPLIVD